MSFILVCSRIISNIYHYFLNFVIFFTSHLSSILTLFFLKSLVKLLFYDRRSSILTQILLFHQLFHCHKCSCGQEPIANSFISGYSSAAIFLFPLVLNWYSIGQL